MSGSRRPTGERGRWTARALASHRIVLCLLRRLVGATEVPVGFDSERARILADLETPLGRWLYRYGLWNEDLERVGGLLRPGDGFLDGGAHIGLFSLVAAGRVGPGGRVAAVEPTPPTARRLRHNLELNGFTWAEVHESALADEVGTEDLVVFDRSAGGTNSFAPSNPSAGERIAVATTTVDRIVAEDADLRERLALVKLDCEGAEARVLQGCQYVLEHVRCPFLVEVAPEHLARQGRDPDDIYRVFEQAGYRADHAADGYNVWFVPRTSP